MLLNHRGHHTSHAAQCSSQAHPRPPRRSSPRTCRTTRQEGHSLKRGDKGWQPAQPSGSCLSDVLPHSVRHACTCKRRSSTGSNRRSPHKPRAPHDNCQLVLWRRALPHKAVSLADLPSCSNTTPQADVSQVSDRKASIASAAALPHNAASSLACPQGRVVPTAAWVVCGGIKLLLAAAARA